MEDGYFQAVLFDLDGTLVDTAPDMVAVLQAMQTTHGIDQVDYALGRSHVSNGAIGLLRLGFPEVHIEFGDDLHNEFLER
jgi:phosphoglycolate phosphatase